MKKDKLVRVSDDTHKKLKEISDEVGMPMSHIVTMLCNQWKKENRKAK